MANNLGKKFETKLQEDWLKIAYIDRDGDLCEGDIERLKDPGFGMKGISNISDFIAYASPLHFYIECKSIKGNTFPLVNLKQYKKLIEKEPVKGVRRGVVIWFYEKDKVIYVPITTIQKMKEDGKKSVNIRTDLDKYRIIEIPSKKKRTFMDSDYSILIQELKEGE